MQNGMNKYKVLSADCKCKIKTEKRIREKKRTDL